MFEGERIAWRSLNRTMYGTITGTTKLGYIARLDRSGKSVIVHPKSIIDHDKTSG